ncbi:MAG: ABC transporter permease [Thermoplasmatales archaeon]|nr:ABC transporter permease [Thermoplasmatales archaeon]MCW6170576.1 ABC transporter permease [Thermoplasmatales archaeon]
MASPFGSFATTYSYYFKNYYRSKSFYLMLIIIVLVSVLLSYFSIRYINDLSKIFPGIPASSFTSPIREDVLGYIWSFVMTDLPVFAAVFFGSSAISSEIENKTAYHIFPLPVSRFNLLVSKYFAAVSVTIIVISIYVAMQAGVFFYLFGSVIPALPKSYLLLVLFIFSIMALTFLISSIFNKNTYAYISVFLIYFLVFNAYLIVEELLFKTTPYYLLNVAASIIKDVYLNASSNPFSFSTTLNSPSTTEMLRSILIMVIYGIVSFSVAAVIFERKDVK